MQFSVQSKGQSKVVTDTGFRIVPVLLVGLGLALRLWQAHTVFLNPDEALHYLLSLQSSLWLTYKATLTTAHPPLYIVMLHYWAHLGTSEFFLRIPSVLAGTGFCWMVFLWLRRAAGQAVAVVGLALLLFSPALVYLSAELRQYSLLLFFCASALYLLERGLAESSVVCMLLFWLALDLALSTHYSAFLFALAIGVYFLVRVGTAKPTARVIAVWAAAQVVALSIVVLLLKTHVAQLEARSLPEKIGDSYLKASIFHSDRDHVVTFIFRTTIALFHYLFSQGAVGVAGLLLFGTAIVLLWREREVPAHPRSMTSRQLGLVLGFPLVANCAFALARIYPYGGTRHDSYLSIFALSGVAIAIARWRPAGNWTRTAAVAAVLVICNAFPSPMGQYIRRNSQDRAVMQQAVDFLKHNATPGSVVLTDNQGGLLLSYYFCGHPAVQFEPPYDLFHDAPCGRNELLSLTPNLWIFKAATFPDQLHELAKTPGLGPGQPVWLFQAGWFIDQEKDLRAELGDFGCPATRDFGQNILVCRLTLPADESSSSAADLKLPGPKNALK